MVLLSLATSVSAAKNRSVISRAALLLIGAIRGSWSTDFSSPPAHFAGAGLGDLIALLGAASRDSDRAHRRTVPGRQGDAGLILDAGRCQCAVQPPSMHSDVPLMNGASDEQR